MDIKNDLQGLQQLFSSQQVAGSAAARTQQAAEQTSAGADEATLSPAASLAAQAAPDADVRMDKVNQVQQALAAGTYSVPSSEVAGKMIESMLGK